jgi:hypothetical protein
MEENKISITSAFLTGLVITPLILFITLGENFVSLVLISIVCTLGISLVIWLPLIWLIGYMSLSIIYFIITQFNQSSSPDNQGLLSVNNNQIYSLVDYIKKAQAKGYSDSQIETRLKEKGWTQVEINQAFQLVN